MTFVYHGVGIAAWIAVYALKWYAERGWYETQALRRSRFARRFALAPDERPKDIGTLLEDEFADSFTSRRFDRPSPAGTAVQGAARDGPYRPF